MAQACGRWRGRLASGYKEEARWLVRGLATALRSLHVQVVQHPVALVVERVLRRPEVRTVVRVLHLRRQLPQHCHALVLQYSTVCVM